MDFSQEFEDWSREKLIEARHQLNQLVASPGWQLYSLLGGQQIRARTDGIILQPLQGMDAALAQEYAKGEVAGIRLATHLAETMIEAITSTLKDMEVQNALDDSQVPEAE